MEEKYEFIPAVFYEHPENFKQKSMTILMNLLGNSLMDFIKFDSYAIITTEGNKQDKFVIETVDKFSRAKINCLVYNIRKNKYNDIDKDGYDKLFIYYTALNKTQLYSFFMYNTKTGKSKHIYYIDFADDTLAIKIKNSIVFNGTRKKIFDYYGEKYDFIKGKNTHRYNRHTISEYNEMIKDYNETISEKMFDIQYVPNTPI